MEFPARRAICCFCALLHPPHARKGSLLFGCLVVVARFSPGKKRGLKEGSTQGQKKRELTLRPQTDPDRLARKITDTLDPKTTLNRPKHRFEVNLTSILGQFGVDLGSIWGRSLFWSRSIWGQLGVDFGSTSGRLPRGRFWVNLRSLWGRVRVAAFCGGFRAPHPPLPSPDPCWTPP